MNMNQAILEAMDALEPNERRIVALCFGIDNERPRTLEEIGEELGITAEQVEEIKINALRKLRHPSFADGLSEQEEGREH